jgi:hypothetical protein
VFAVVDLSSREEDAFPDTSQDEEIVRKLFGDLNRGLLGLPDDDNMIILNDSDEEEEVREDDRADAEATPSSETPWPQLPPPPMMHPTGCKMIVMMVRPPIGCKMIVVTMETRPIHLRLPTHPMGCKMIVMMIRPPIGCKMIVVAMETRPIRLRLPQ